MTALGVERPFLTAAWQNLLMLNFAVDPALLRSRVPRGTELDTHDNTCYASIVAFQFRDTRVLGVPVPWHRDFTELNIRFYVRRERAGEQRRGVVFIREVVPRLAIGAVARLVYNEPYVTVPMRELVAPPAVRYGLYLDGRWQDLEGTAAGPGVQPAPGSHEEFITDHAWGYTAQRDGGTIEYRVEHEHWPVRHAQTAAVHADLGSLCGRPLADQLQKPRSALMVDGSKVIVYRPTRLEPR